MAAKETAASVVPPGYKQTEVGMIPEEWEVVKLGDIIKNTQLGINAKSSVNTKGIPLLKMGNLTKGGFDFEKLENISNNTENINEYYLKFGDFLFNTRNTPELVGKSAVWKWNDSKIIFNNNIMRINFNQNIDSFFYGFYFASDTGWKQLKKISKGTTSVGAIYNKDLIKLKVPLPPLTEQQKIAAILTSVDNKIEIIDEQIAKTEMLKKGLMQKLLSEGIGHTEFRESEVGRIPKEWEVVRQGDVAKFFNGRAYKLSEWEEEGTPVIRLQNLTGSGTEYYYSTMKLPEHQYVYNGDLIYMWSATFGVYIWKGEKAIYHYHIWKVECSNSLDKMYMYYSLDKLTEKLKQSSHGATMLHITKSGMEKTLMALPPITEQKQIAKILSTTDDKLDTLRAKKEKYESLKKGLMQKLLTGEVRVKR